MSQKESMLERILRFIRREKLVGMCRIGNKVYEFWENKSHYTITGSDNGEPFKPVRRRKYKPIYNVDMEELINYSGTIEEFLYTDDYKTYLENKNRLLASSLADSQNRAATQA